ncbi:MAG: hypothetical protein ACKVX9_24780 [Blastocatellia bacterium]
MWKGTGILILIALGACSSRRPAEVLTTEQALAGLSRCAPEEAGGEGWSMKITSISRDSQSTRVGIAVSTTAAPVDFDLPVYRLSRGRWLINQSGRAYLLDRDCREYKLKDRKPSPGQEIPLEGRIRVTPAAPFEATLIFPRIPDASRVGMLVYNGRKLPFTIGIESR